MNVPICRSCRHMKDHGSAHDARPVVHARWEPGNPLCPVCGQNKFKGLDADVWADWTPPFCPNCGAQMDEKEESNDGNPDL